MTTTLTPVGTRFPGPLRFGFGAAQSTPAATTTDLITLYGSSTRTVKVRRIVLSGLSTTAGTMDAQIVKRTAANTGGTASAKTPAKYDSGSADATAVLSLYTANPTSLGAGIVLGARMLNFGLAGASGSLVWEFSKGDEPVLRGSSQGIAVNLNGSAVPAGGKISWTVEWIEE